MTHVPRLLQKETPPYEDVFCSLEIGGGSGGGGVPLNCAAVAVEKIFHFLQEPLRFLTGQRVLGWV